MSKQIDYTATIDATAQNAKDTIDTLASERSAGNITDYSVEYRADVGRLRSTFGSTWQRPTNFLRASIR